MYFLDLRDKMDIIKSDDVVQVPVILHDIVGSNLNSIALYFKEQINESLRGIDTSKNIVLQFMMANNDDCLIFGDLLLSGLIDVLCTSVSKFNKIIPMPRTFIINNLDLPQIYMSKLINNVCILNYINVQIINDDKNIIVYNLISDGELKGGDLDE